MCAHIMLLQYDWPYSLYCILQPQWLICFIAGGFYLLVSFTDLHFYCEVLNCFSCIYLFETLRTVAHQALLSMRFSRQEYWSGLPYPSPGMEPESLMSPALAGGFFTTSTKRKDSNSVSWIPVPHSITVVLKDSLPWQGTPNLSSHGLPPCDHRSPKTGFLTGPQTLPRRLSLCPGLCSCTSDSSQIKFKLVHAKLLQSCPVLCNLVDCNPLGSSVHGDSPGKKTAGGCHALLLHGIFLTQGSNLHLLSLPALAGFVLFLTSSATWGAPVQTHLLWKLLLCLPQVLGTASS